MMATFLLCILSIKICYLNMTYKLFCLSYKMLKRRNKHSAISVVYLKFVIWCYSITCSLIVTTYFSSSSQSDFDNEACWWYEWTSLLNSKNYAQSCWRTAKSKFSFYIYICKWCVTFTCRWVPWGSTKWLIDLKIMKRETFLVKSIPLV